MTPPPNVESDVLESEDDELDELAAAVAVANSRSIRDAFNGVPGGDQYYEVFRRAMKAEVKRLAGGETEDEALELMDVISGLKADAIRCQEMVRSLSNERLFAVLNIVMRNFGGSPIPPPAQPAPAPAPAASVAPPAKNEDARKPSLKRKFAATNAHEVEAAAAAQPQAPVSSGQAAPTMPPRGNRITGLF